MTARKSPLRAVGPDEVVTAARTPMTVTGAANDGDRRDLLSAMRERVAQAVEDGATPARDLAALTRRLMEIAREIEAIDAREHEESEDAQPAADEEWQAV